MLFIQKSQDSDVFGREVKLKQLVASQKVSIVYIHGTARSGSTIAEIVLAQLADLAIHQPFRGTLQKSGGRFRENKLEDCADIYDSACGLISQQIEKCLETKEKITVVIKELAGFFKPNIWQRWLEIPDKFLFTVREPHLQYMSWLSAMTDKIFQGKGTLQGDRSFAIARMESVENAPLSAEWEGTTLSCNQNAWNASIEDFNKAKNHTHNTKNKVAVLDSVLLRYNPEIAIKNAIAKLGFTSEKLSLLNLTGLAKTESKVWDIRDKNRPMVRKANSSNSINPVTAGEGISLDIFSPRSRQHIENLIPLYLEILYAEEQAYLPSLEELNRSAEIGLIVAHPFIAYAIAWFHLQDKNLVNNWLKSMGQDELIDSFQNSFAVVDNYWEQARKNYG